jgi:hypothetical protein
MSRIHWIDTTLWCFAGGLMLVDFVNLLGPSGDPGKASLLVGSYALARVLRREMVELRRSFENSVGRAYRIGRRAERRLQAADHEPLARVRVLRG